MISRMYTHTVDITRNSNVLVTNTSLPVSETINTTYRQPIVVDISIPSGYGTFRVNGSLAGVTVTTDVVFTSGETILKKQTSKSFDRLTTITSVSGTAPTMSASILTRAGSPFLTEEPVHSSLECRLDNIGPGSPFFSDAGLLKPDESILYTDCAERSIKMDDLVLDLTSGVKYRVVDTDIFYNAREYVFTALKLSKI